MKNNKMKTSPVSWLVEELKKFGTHIPKLWFDHALQMEAQKQQKYDEMLAMLNKVAPILESYGEVEQYKEVIQLIKEAKEL